MKISIPKPCHENWNEMLPEEKGRFCLSCQKCVLDLTNESDEEILSISKQKNICVRLDKNQIERINSKPSFQLPNWLRYSSLLVWLGLNSFGLAQNKSELRYTTSQIEELIKKDTLITVKLQVIDDFDESPIPNAKVYLNKKKKKYNTITDHNGYFELEIPTKYLNDFLIVETEHSQRDYKIRYILNQEKIGNEIYLGMIEVKK